MATNSACVFKFVQARYRCYHDERNPSSVSLHDVQLCTVGQLALFSCMVSHQTTAQVVVRFYTHPHVWSFDPIDLSCLVTHQIEDRATVTTLLKHTHTRT